MLRLSIRFLGRQAAPDVVVGQQLDVRFELLGKIAVRRSKGEAAEQAMPRAAEQADHDFMPFSARKRATMSLAWAHWETSASSCFWPALVMR